MHLLAVRLQHDFADFGRTYVCTYIYVARADRNSGEVGQAKHACV